MPFPAIPGLSINAGMVDEMNTKVLCENTLPGIFWCWQVDVFLEG
ncbi:MAG: hypothetical protein ACI9K5_003701 [Gammaproteobacteria bacterium]|jgi:hypothetical protein